MHIYKNVDIRASVSSMEEEEKLLGKVRLDMYRHTYSATSIAVQSS